MTKKNVISVNDFLRINQDNRIIEEPRYQVTQENIENWNDEANFKESASLAKTIYEMEEAIKNKKNETKEGKLDNPIDKIDKKDLIAQNIKINEGSKVKIEANVPNREVKLPSNERVDDELVYDFFEQHKVQNIKSQKEMDSSIKKEQNNNVIIFDNNKDKIDTYNNKLPIPVKNEVKENVNSVSISPVESKMINKIHLSQNHNIKNSLIHDYFKEVQKSSSNSDVNLENFKKNKGIAQKNSNILIPVVESKVDLKDSENKLKIARFKMNNHEVDKISNLYAVDSDSISDVNKTDDNEDSEISFKEKALSKRGYDQQAKDRVLQSKYDISDKQIQAKELNAPNPYKRVANITKTQILPPNIGQKVYDDNNKHLVPVEFKYELVDAAFKNINTPDRVNIIKGIINKLQDVNLQDDSGNTLLMHATNNKDYALINMLLSNGIDINIKNNDGFNALHLAASYGDYKALYNFVQSGANINIQDSEGNIPLSYSIAIGDFDSIRLLMDYGSKIDIKNINGLTSLDIAKINGNNEIYQYLLRKSKSYAINNNFGKNINNLNRLYD